MQVRSFVRAFNEGAEKLPWEATFKFWAFCVDGLGGTTSGGSNWYGPVPGAKMAELYGTVLRGAKFRVRPWKAGITDRIDRVADRGALLSAKEPSFVQWSEGRRAEKGRDEGRLAGAAVRPTQQPNYVREDELRAKAAGEARGVGGGKGWKRWLAVLAMILGVGSAGASGERLGVGSAGASGERGAEVSGIRSLRSQAGDRFEGASGVSTAASTAATCSAYAVPWRTNVTLETSPRQQMRDGLSAEKSGSGGGEATEGQERAHGSIWEYGWRGEREAGNGGGEPPRGSLGGKEVGMQTSGGVGGNGSDPGDGGEVREARQRQRLMLVTTNDSSTELASGTEVIGHATVSGEERGRNRSATSQRHWPVRIQASMTARRRVRCVAMRDYGLRLKALKWFCAARVKIHSRDLELRAETGAVVQSRARSCGTRAGNWMCEQLKKRKGRLRYGETGDPRKI